MAIAVIFAPIIGPTLGGWITDNYIVALGVPDQRAGGHRCIHRGTCNWSRIHPGCSATGRVCATSITAAWG